MASNITHPPPRSRTRPAGRHLVHPSGCLALLTTRQREPGGIRSSHADTLPIMWMLQECSRPRVAATPRHAGPERRDQERCVAPASPTSLALDPVTTQSGSALAGIEARGLRDRGG
ncbi:hypothetical protein Q4I32_000640 [Leishmania shawi]|uniref:Uncharacterized protein n=1 Tax=Leishmania shawi TaxID=5680 RepID=A0AAW3CDC0_9TRYP